MLLVLFQLCLLSISGIKCDCVFLSECPAAVKHATFHRNDPDSRKMLREAHCGFDKVNGNNLPKVYCDRITDIADNDDGCVKIQDCPAAIQLIKSKRYDPKVIALLRSAACTKQGRMDLVRCKDISGASTTTTDKVSLLAKPDQCGAQSTTEKIFFGKKADLDEFPWVALIKYRNFRGDINFGCHGSLISPKYVVTAGHCIHLLPAHKERVGDVYLVVFGEYDVKTEKDCTYNKAGQVEDCADPIKEFYVEKTIAHPEFEYPEGHHDIGLIRLQGTVTYSDFVGPICLPLTPLDLKNNEGLFITGWGKTENGVLSDVKLKAVIFFIPKNECASHFRGNRNFDGQVCAGANNGSDICNGDSGGPLMAFRLRNGEPRTFLAGVVSYNIRCGLRASVYTDVNLHLNWIFENIEE